MKKAVTDIPKYDLKKFKTVHQKDGKTLASGYNHIDKSKMIDGFEIYSSDLSHHSI